MVIHLHARAGEVAFVRALLDAGVDVNIPENDVLLARPIYSAVSSGSVEMVRMLLDRGSDVNWGWGDGPAYCEALAIATQYGRFEIVQLLVEAEAFLNVIDRAGQTPLSWAIASGRQDIIDYLRSKGAVLPKETPGYTPPPASDPVEDRVRSVAVRIVEEPLAQDGPVLIRLGDANNDGDSPILFTQGMASRAMHVPAGGEAYQHAELVLYLRLDPFSDDASDWQEPELSWYLDWLLKIARWPFENNTWLNGQWTVISNGDKPRQLSKYTKMTCWLLLGEKEPLERVELPDGRSVCFYTLLPIHTAERDLALSEGLVALLQRFADNEVPIEVDEQRKSVV